MMERIGGLRKELPELLGVRKIPTLADGVGRAGRLLGLRHHTSSRSLRVGTSARDEAIVFDNIHTSLADIYRRSSECRLYPAKADIICGARSKNIL